VFGEEFGQFTMSHCLKRVRSINSNECKRFIIEQKPEIVLVFGTKFIRTEVYKNPVLQNTSWINLHWGISPFYRGEGLISALALGGINDVGVTIHHLSNKADAGDILYQAIPKLEKLDNFYSVGLKLTKIGANIFEKILTKYQASGVLPPSQSQDLTKGFMYNTPFMREHPEFQTKAWTNLKNLR